VSCFICACSGIYAVDYTFGDLFQLEDNLFLLGPQTNGFILFLFLGTLFSIQTLNCLPTPKQKRTEPGLLSIFVIYILLFCFVWVLNKESTDLLCLQVPAKFINCPYNFNTLFFGDCVVFVIMLFLCSTFEYFWNNRPLPLL